jgi:hypothetical protein
VKKTETLLITFDGEIKPQDLPKFRGAIIQAGGKGDLFHQHKDDGRTIGRYPLIQYKILHKKPALFCLGAGTFEAMKLFQGKPLELRIGDQVHHWGIFKMRADQSTFQAWDRTIDYHISNWLALNHKNTALFNSLNHAPEEQMALLEKILIGNIITMAKGIGWTVDKTVEVRMYGTIHQATRTYKSQGFHSFSCTFQCNVSLPNGIGLGKGASHGFGTIWRKQQFDRTEP